jgi:hypothetical protein
VSTGSPPLIELLAFDPATCGATGAVMTLRGQVHMLCDSK